MQHFECPANRNIFVKSYLPHNLVFFWIDRPVLVQHIFSDMYIPDVAQDEYSSGLGMSWFDDIDEFIERAFQ